MRPALPLFASVSLALTLALPISAMAAPRYARLETTDQAAPPLAERPGGPDKLPGLRGRPVLINFWATWCEPCREEMPALDQLRRTHPDLTVLTVAVADSRSAVTTFFDEYLLDLPVIHDPESQQSRVWEARVLPTTVLLDGEGRVRYRAVGALDWHGPEVGRILERLQSPRGH